MNDNKDIKNIQESMFVQSNYYARELEYVIDTIKQFSRNINVDIAKKNDNVKLLLNYINNIKYKDVFNSSKEKLQCDMLTLKLKEKNNKLLHEKKE